MRLSLLFLLGLYPLAAKADPAPELVYSINLSADLPALQAATTDADGNATCPNASAGGACQSVLRFADALPAGAKVLSLQCAEMVPIAGPLLQWMSAQTFIGGQSAGGYYFMFDLLDDTGAHQPFNTPEVLAGTTGEFSAFAEAASALPVDVALTWYSYSSDPSTWWMPGQTDVSQLTAGEFCCDLRYSLPAPSAVRPRSKPVRGMVAPHVAPRLERMAPHVAALPPPPVPMQAGCSVGGGRGGYLLAFLVAAGMAVIIGRGWLRSRRNS